MNKRENKTGKSAIVMLGWSVVSVLIGVVFASIVMALETTSTEDMRRLASNSIPDSEDTGLMMKYAQPYQVEEAGSNTYYTRWHSGTGKVLLMRTKKTGLIWTYEKATDTWANRVTATYTAVNE